MDNKSFKSLEAYYIEQILAILKTLDEAQLQYVNAFIRERFSVE